MSNDTFKKVFGQFPGLDAMHVLRSTRIVIIALDQERRAKWQASAFWESMRAENIHIAFLKSPCCYKRADKQIIPEIETKFMMTSDFWQVVCMLRLAIRPSSN